MTEEVLHELFHTLLPTLAGHVDYLLAGLVAALLAWTRSKLQVSAAEIAALQVELEANVEATLGQKPEGAIKKARAVKRARANMHPLVRPRKARLDALVERMRPK